MPISDAAPPGREEGFGFSESGVDTALMRSAYQPQNCLLFAPPPVERQVNDGPAYFWQYAVGSMLPAPEAVMSAASQLKKQ